MGGFGPPFLGHFGPPFLGHFGTKRQARKVRKGGSGPPPNLGPPLTFWKNRKNRKKAIQTPLYFRVCGVFDDFTDVLDPFGGSGGSKWGVFDPFLGCFGPLF